MFVSSDTRGLRKGPKLISVLLSLPIIIGLLLLVRMPLQWTDQAVFSALIIAFCIAAGIVSESRFVTSTLTVVSVFCTMRYFVWRWSSSISYLNNSGWNVDKLGLAFALLLLCAETYSVLILLLGYFQSARPLKRRPVPLPKDTESWPAVDVFIPTYNEPLDVVRPTVLAALSIDWPLDKLHVYILDDGRRTEFEAFAAECGSGYLTRSDNFHAKAGNINSALKRTTSEYVAIFDCDHIATRSFLQLTMGWFERDARLAMVQTPHHFYSPDPFERNLNVFRTIPNEGALFYGVVQDGNDLWNATFFCGSCAVIKREALEQIGGIAVETVTEDAHTALRLQKLGWNTAYIGIPQAAGLATGSLAAHVGQRIRWARGMVQILRTEFPLFAGGLKLSQRLCYMNCVVHYLYAIPRLIFVSAPLVYLLLGKSNLYGYIWEILAYAAPHLVLSNMVNSRSQGNHRHSFWNEIYEMVLAPYILLPTTFALINPKWGKFNVTAKSSMVEESFFDWRIARPYLFLIALNIIAVMVAIPRYFMASDPSGVLLINIVWAMVNMLMLGACVAASYENKQRRTTARVEAQLSATLALGTNNVHHCQVIDLSEGGLALRSERVFDCKAGQNAEVTIRSGPEEYQFNVEAVRLSENRIHLRFLQNDLKHQKAITRIVYMRADSWLDWTKDQRRDRIIGSLLHVLRIGVGGIWMLPSLLIRRERKTTVKTLKASSQKTAVLGIALLAMLASTPRAKGVNAAQEQPDSTVPVTSGSETVAGEKQQSFEEWQSFAELGKKSVLVLHGDKARANFPFTVPGTKIVDIANLELRYQVNDLPASDEYRLAVMLNDVKVDTVVIRGGGSTEKTQIVLPADLLVHDNKFSFELHRECATPCKVRDGETSVVIQADSRLSTSGTALHLPNRLSMLPAPFFDPSVQRTATIPFVFESQPDLDTLKAAGIVASWYGSLAGFRGSHFDIELGRIPKGNAIIFAQPGGALASALKIQDLDAQVGVFDNPEDAYSKVLVLTARSTKDFVQLGKILAKGFASENADRVVLQPDQLASANLTPTAPTWFDGSRPLTITRGLSDNLLHARVNAPTKLYFRLAPDLNYDARITVPLQLTFRLYGLAADDHALLIVRLNDSFIDKRRLANKDSKGPRTESFAIPTSLLYASNTLSIELATNYSDATVLDPTALDLQLLPETNLDLKNPTHFVRMPRLDLFASAGYPFTNQPDGSETAVVIPKVMSTTQIGLYLDAMGFLSNQTGMTSTRFDVIRTGDVPKQRTRNLLVLANQEDPTTFERFANSMVVIPFRNSFALSENSLPIEQWLSRAWFGRREDKIRLNSLLEREDGPKFLMEQFVSPVAANHSVLLLADRGDDNDQPYFSRLAEANRNGLINGGVVLADDSHIYSFQINSGAYPVGKSWSLAGVFAWLQFHLWILPIFLIGAAMVIAHRWEQLLAQQAERRLQIGSR
jgi:cellulose synthase (UDP-forming)